VHFGKNLQNQRISVLDKGMMLGLPWKKILPQQSPKTLSHGWRSASRNVYRPISH